MKNRIKWKPTLFLLLSLVAVNFSLTLMFAGEDKAAPMANAPTETLGAKSAQSPADLLPE